jgi:hypothetical protein
MSQKPLPLYAVKDHPGAHILRGMRETVPVPSGPTVDIADVLLVGAQLPFSVPRQDVTAYKPENAFPCDDSIAALAQEAVTVYGADPERTIKAALMLYADNNKYTVALAQYDEDGVKITPSHTCYRVQSSNRKGWYIVRPGKCTCKDSQMMNVCKHRIAAWMQRERTLRPYATARRVIVAQLVSLIDN